MNQYIEQIINCILNDFTSSERREFVFLSNHARNIIQKYQSVLSCSFGEGLVNHADIDWMCFCFNYFIVDFKYIHTEDFDFINDIKSDLGILIIDTENCNPGFARLLVHKERINSNPYEYCFHNGKKYFNGKNFIKNMVSNVRNVSQNHIPKVRFIAKGPSVKKFNPEFTVDYAYCFPCLKDIQPTDTHIQLPLLCEDFYQKNNFFFVHKSRECSRCPDIEFRWSFSFIENQTVLKFTDVEFKLYFICKELYNTYIKSSEERKTCISSYSIKTLIFHFRDRNQEQIKSESIIDLVKLFLCIMKRSIREKYLPQYFIRKYNIFDILKDNEAKVAVHQIEKIENNLVLAILNCKFFRKFESLVTLHSIY